MRTSIRHMAAAAVACLAWTAASAAGAGLKVVYHIDEGLAKASALLRNVNNHLNADPDAKIVVVAHSHGIDFLLDGAKDKNNSPFEATVDTLMGRGVEFRVCNNTLKSRHIDPKQVIMGAHIVPSGVAEIARLQAKEGYVYLKP